MYKSYHNICFHLELEECSLNFANDFKDIFLLMALDKKRASNMPSKLAVKVEMVYGHHL